MCLLIQTFAVPLVVAGGTKSSKVARGKSKGRIDVYRHYVVDFRRNACAAICEAVLAEWALLPNPLGKLAPLMIV